MERIQELSRQVQTEVTKIIVGKEEHLRLMLAAILAEGHILLDDLQRRISSRIATLVGSVQEVLCEGVSSRNESRWTGRTGTNFVVHFEPDDQVKTGDLRKVKITRAGTVSLFGTLI